MEMQLKRGRALSLAFGAALVASLGVPMVAFADDAQGSSAGDPAAAQAAASESIASAEALQGAIDAAEDGVQTTVTLTGSIVFEPGQVVTVPAGKDIVLGMAGNSITCTDDYVGRPFANKGTLTVTGDGVIDTSMSQEGYGAINNEGALTIENGTYAGHWLTNGSAIRNTGSAAVLTINGGTFLSGDKPFEIAEGYLAPGMSQDENGSVVVDKASNVATVAKDGVIVGAYPTLEEAIAAAKDGGVVTLLGNLSADQVSSGDSKYINITEAGTDVTIDLNGCTITLDSADTISVSAADVNLAVKNGTIINTNKDSYGLYTYATNDNINVVLEDLVLRTVDQAVGVQGLNSNQNVTLKNCDITCDTTAVYWPPKSGILTIEDTSIEADSGVTIKGGEVVVKGDTYIKATGKKEIPEDYYDGNPGKNLISTGAAIYVESGYNDRDIALDIQSGTFESEQGNTVLYFVKDGESATVDRDIAISGGTFIGEAPAPEFIVPGAGLQLDENGDLVAVSAKLVPVADKVVDGVHVYDVKGGIVDTAYLLGLMGMNVDVEKSGYELAVSTDNIDALNEAIDAKQAGATFDFTYTAAKQSEGAATLADAGTVDPVTVTVKLVDTSTTPGGGEEGGDEGNGDDQGDGQDEGGTSSDEPSTGGDKLPATGDGSMQVAGAAAVAGIAAMGAIGAMAVRRKQD